MFSTRNLSKHQPPCSTKCGTLNDFLMGSGWWVRCLFSVYDKTWRNRLPPCAQCGLENKVRYCPMISIHLQNRCCNSASMVISRFVQITYSFTVETTCSCKKCSCILQLWNKHDAEYQAVFEPKDSVIFSSQNWNHSVSKLGAKCEKLQSWILMLGFSEFLCLGKKPLVHHILHQSPKMAVTYHVNISGRIPPPLVMWYLLPISFQNSLVTFQYPKTSPPKLVTSCCGAEWTPGAIWWIHTSHTSDPSIPCFIASVSRDTSVHKTQMQEPDVSKLKAVGCPDSRKLCRCEEFCLRHFWSTLHDVHLNWLPGWKFTQSQHHMASNWNRCQASWLRGLDQAKIADFLFSKLRKGFEQGRVQKHVDKTSLA